MVRMYQNKIIVLSITIFLKYINGIAVLRSRKPLQSTNFAEINDSSLNGLDRFTICARFFPYQFQDSFHYMQDIISTGSKETTLFKIKDTEAALNFIKTILVINGNMGRHLEDLVMLNSWVY